MDIYERVLKEIDRNEEEMVRFLSNLIRIPSINLGEPNTAEEGPVQALVTSQMQAMNLDVKQLVYDFEEKRPNVYGRWKGAGGGESILFNAHADVVPVGEAAKWTCDPFGGEVKNGRIWGRGAADDKQGIAAMVFAVKALQQAGVRLKGDVLLVSSVGEESAEGGTLGVGRALQDIPQKPSLAVVAESTAAIDLDIEGPSLFFFELIVKGKSIHCGDRNLVIYPQHSSMPCGNEVGADALLKTLPILEMLYRKERDWAVNWRTGIVGGGGTSTFDKKGVGIFNINIYRIEGGTYLGSVPGEIRVYASVCHPQECSSEEVFQSIKEDVLAIASTDSWLKANPPDMILRKDMHLWSGYQVKPEHPGVKAAERAHLKMTGKQINLTGFKAVCDASFIQKAGIPPIVYGAGESGHGVHGVDESCSIALFKRTCCFFAGLMMEWCGVV